VRKRLSFIFATLALSAGAAFGQLYTAGGSYAVGYAANLNIGDSVVNLSNSGDQGGFFGATFGGGAPAPTIGNICVNTYVFDPQEEEIGCCACLVTPNGLNSLSAKADLISNNLTPAVPTSIVIKLVASEPGVDKNGAFTVCNPATVVNTAAAQPYYPSPVAAVGDPNKGFLAGGLAAWGNTLEPNSTPGTYGVVNVPYLFPIISVGASELSALTRVCNFIQANGTGFGICKSCRLGALGGAKQ
jgi:hypothetical protein